MKIHPTAPTVLVLATVVLTGLTGCGATGGGTAASGSSVAAGMGSADNSADDSADDGSATPALSDSAKSAPKRTKIPTHGSTPTHTPTTHSTKTHDSTQQGPHVSFKIVQKPKCPEGTAVFRAKAVPLIIKWKITGAESGALSVDDPTNTPGTYGPVGLSGTEEFTFSCGGPVGSTETHSYVIYSVGGGAQKHKKLTASAKVLDQGRDNPPPA